MPLEAVIELESLSWGPFGPPQDERQCREVEIHLTVEKREVLWERGLATAILVDRTNVFGPEYYQELLMKQAVTVGKIKAVASWNEAAQLHIEQHLECITLNHYIKSS